LTDEGTYDFVESCKPKPPPEDIDYPYDWFRKVCTDTPRDWYAKLEEIGYWAMRYDMMLEDIIYYFHI
jgi:hypothetical protein